VCLAGRTLATLEEVAEAIRATGGAAETAKVDALDEQAVDRHADAVAAEAGAIDISFNLVTHPHTHGIPLVEMRVDDFMAPVETAARSSRSFQSRSAPPARSCAGGFAECGTLGHARRQRALSFL
jgi:NAD(P)-dependent dehydrogenase (short-subunit alcohol dehydrogenase family)